MAETVLDPRNGAVCPALANVTILVSNYASIPHPDPYLNAVLDSVLSGFDQALRAVLASVNVPAGSKLAVVDVYTPSIGQQGLLLIQRQFGYTGGFDFDAHPTNEGHAFIAAKFAAAWQRLQ